MFCLTTFQNISRPIIYVLLYLIKILFSIHISFSSFFFSKCEIFEFWMWTKVEATKDEGL